jgi:hypothetical protein
MKMNGWHCLLALLVGYLIGYYFPQLGQSTVGRLMPKQG